MRADIFRRALVYTFRRMAIATILGLAMGLFVYFVLRYGVLPGMMKTFHDTTSKQHQK